MSELQIAKFINQLGSGTIIDKITILISNYYFLVVLFLVFLIFLWKDKKRRGIVLFTVILAFLVDILVTEGLFKHLFLNFVSLRERPYLAYPQEIVALGNRSIDASFPSGHTSGIAAVLTPVVYYYRKFWPVALFLVFLMGFTRIHNGMHWPTDVLAGSIFGIFYGLLAINIAKLWYDEFRAKLNWRGNGKSN